MAGQAAVTLRDKQWSVSLAVAPWEMTKGLGGLPGISAATGMLFDMGVPQTIQVTTVPMLFPLDIAFLSDTLVITEVYRDVQPGYLVTSTMQARYFLEVNAGELEGIEAGDKAMLEVIVPAQATAPDWASALFGFMGFMVIGVFTVSLVKDLVKGIFGEPEKRPELLPQTRRQGKFIIQTDRMGNIIITHSERPKRSVFLQFESDKELVYDMLKKSEREDLDKGWNVEVKDGDLRASLLQELWETSAESEELPKLSRTVGNEKLVVWVRYGDVSHYFDFDSPYDAGRGAGIILALYPPRELSYRYVSAGVEVKPFYIGRNHILLFWGDEKAQWQRDLSDAERKEFERGVEETLAIPYASSTEKTDTEVMRYRVEENRPYGTWAIVELWPGGTVRTPFESKEAAIKREEEIGKYYGWKLKRVELTKAQHDLLDSQRFPERQEALDKLRGYDVVEVHDDGDLTVRSRGKFYVVTTQGQTFEQKEYLAQTRQPGESTARPKVIPVEKTGRKATSGGLEYFADSPEFLTQTIEDIGYRERIDRAFQKAIARARQGQ